MSKSKKLTVREKLVERQSIDDFDGMSMDMLAVWVQTNISRYGASAKIDIYKDTVPYSETEYTYYDIYITRLETDEEYKTRTKVARDRATVREAQEILELKRLAEKYPNVMKNKAGE